MFLKGPDFETDEGYCWETDKDSILVQRYHYDLYFQANHWILPTTFHIDYSFIACRGKVRDRTVATDPLHESSLVGLQRYYWKGSDWMALPFSHGSPKFRDLSSGGASDSSLVQCAKGVLDVGYSPDEDLVGAGVGFGWQLLFSYQTADSLINTDIPVPGDHFWQFSVRREPRPIVVRQPYRDV